MNAQFVLRKKRPIRLCPVSNTEQICALEVSMAGTKRTCSTCGNGFIGTARAQYCSPACKQRAHRGRTDASGAPGVTERVTVTAPAGRGSRLKRNPPTTVHCAEALALLAALDQELAHNSVAMMLPPDQPLEWSAAERATLSTIADSVDRRVDLLTRYRASDDDKVRLKFSGEIRLLDMAIDRLLKRVHTDLPPVKSMTSVKAAEAAKTRWARNAAY